MKWNFLKDKPRLSAAGKITIAARNSARGDGSSWRIADVRIGATVAAELGWAKGDRVDIAWSEDPGGRLLLVRRPEGRTALRRKPDSPLTAMSLRCALPRWVVTTHVAEQCPRWGKSAEFDDALEIVIPEHYASQWQAHSTAPKRVPSVVEPLRKRA